MYTPFVYKEEIRWSQLLSGEDVVSNTLFLCITVGGINLEMAVRLYAGAHFWKAHQHLLNKAKIVIGSFSETIATLKN